MLHSFLFNGCALVSVSLLLLVKEHGSYSDCLMPYALGEFDQFNHTMACMAICTVLLSDLLWYINSVHVCTSPVVPQDKGPAVGISC